MYDDFNHTFITNIIPYFNFISNSFQNEQQYQFFKQETSFVFFTIIGLTTSLYAIMFSMNRMLEQNIKCMTGAIVFIPFAIIINCIGVPLLIFIKNRN